MKAQGAVKPGIEHDRMNKSTDSSSLGKHGISRSDKGQESEALMRYVQKWQIQLLKACACGTSGRGQQVLVRRLHLQQAQTLIPVLETPEQSMV